MPLAFASRSHGSVAFGFFNIEIDMLLLEDLFFFADRFCRAVVDLLENQTSLTSPNLSPYWVTLIAGDILAG